MTTSPGRSPELSRLSLEAPERQTAHDAALSGLRRAILSGDLAPGTPLALAQIANELGMSRTPVREALRSLATEGLVDFDAYRSAVVHVATAQEAREIYEIRVVLEDMAVRDAVERSDEEQLAEADRLCDRMEATQALADWTELNRQFHALLLDRVRSDRLRALVASLRDAAAFQVALSLQASGDRMQQANREHRQLVRDFRARDVESAAQHQREHLESTLRQREGADSDSLPDA